MKGYVTNIEKSTLENEHFRNVLYTSENSQLVLMTLQPREDIGEEVHEGHSQFIRIESGVGRAILDGREHVLSDGSAVIIPAGTKHNIVNTSDTENLRLYTLYCPPEHKNGTIHETKADALANEQHFDGVTSE